MNEVWVVRHPPVTVEGVCYGQSDMPAKGSSEDAASEVLTALHVGRFTPRRIVTSPWSRTRGVAKVLSEHLCIPLTEEPRISELHFGIWEGKTYASLAEDPTFNDWSQAWMSEAPPGGESVAMLMNRVREWAKEIALENAPLLAVTHAGVIRALRALSAGKNHLEAEFERVVHLQIERVDLTRFQ